MIRFRMLSMHLTQCRPLLVLSVLGAVDQHNMLQIQRWRRKKKHGDKKKRKSYVKGKVIDGKHELYTLSLAVMHGVRTSIAKTNTLILAADGRRILTPQDFMTEEKYEFAPKVCAIRFQHVVLALYPLSHNWMPISLNNWTILNLIFVMSKDRNQLNAVWR